jgi:RNase HII (EC 3.1.26.4)
MGFSSPCGNTLDSEKLHAQQGKSVRPIDRGKMTKPHFRRERAFLKAGTWPVAGIDEAGRGPLAGPVAAAAVILDPTHVPKGLNDSKLLSAEAREALYETILSQAQAVGVAFASAAEIDRLNIRQATFLAMRRALAALASVPVYVLIDGNDLPPCLVCEGETLIKGDATSASIAAASIVAKVTRDRMMRRLCTLYPHYGFSRHAGYGTVEHRAALALHGPCPFHRMTFAPLRRQLDAA